jgi:hypothetical protein
MRNDWRENANLDEGHDMQRIKQRPRAIPFERSRLQGVLRGGAASTGFRTTREQPGSPLHHGMTRNSAADARAAAKSVPLLVRNELIEDAFLQVSNRRTACGMDHAVTPSSLQAFRKL